MKVNTFFKRVDGQDILVIDPSSIPAPRTYLTPQQDHKAPHSSVLDSKPRAKPLQLPSLALPGSRSSPPPRLPWPPESSPPQPAPSAIPVSSRHPAHPSATEALRPRAATLIKEEDRWKDLQLPFRAALRRLWAKEKVVDVVAPAGRSWSRRVQMRTMEALLEVASTGLWGRCTCATCAAGSSMGLWSCTCT
jgi:hypothetical protein